MSKDNPLWLVAIYGGNFLVWAAVLYIVWTYLL